MYVSPLIVTRKFLTSISGATLLERLLPEINEQILTMAMRGSNYNWDSHVLQAYNSLRNVCWFWRIVIDLESVRDIPPRVYILYEEALSSNLKGSKITLNIQRLIRKAGSSFWFIIVIKGDIEPQK